MTIILKCTLFILTLFLVKVEMQKLGKHNFTSEWLIMTKDSLFPPLVTEKPGGLIYVSFPSDFTIKLESSKIMNKPCEIPAAAIKEHNVAKISPLLAQTLGNGKVIVSLLESKKKMNQSHVWLYVIDPENCTYGSDKFILNAPASLARDSIVVTPYQDSFDVFVIDNIHCGTGNICNLRFNDKPESVEFKKSILPYDDKGWGIATIKGYDPSEGYLYIVMMRKSSSTTIKRLDANLNVLQRADMNHSDSVAYCYDEGGSASLCFGLTDQEIYCVLLDSQMKVKLEVSLYYDSFVQYYSIFRLRNGDAIVLTILNSDSYGSDSATYVQHVSLSGDVSMPVKFQESSCETVFEINTFEITEGLYCASIMCQNLVNTKCIGATENREF